MIYYKQKTKTGCLLDVACTICQKPRRLIKKEVQPEYFKYNYLKYSSFGQILETNDFHLRWQQDGEISRSGRKVLGINLWPTDYNENALHSVYYDGERVWEPWKGEFLNIDNLKIVYSIDVFPKSTATKDVHKFSVDIFEKMDLAITKRWFKGEYIPKKYNYLKVI